MIWPCNDLDLTQAWDIFYLWHSIFTIQGTLKRRVLPSESENYPEKHKYDFLKYRWLQEFSVE